jgi:hypothetical protein
MKKQTHLPDYVSSPDPPVLLSQSNEPHPHSRVFNDKSGLAAAQRQACERTCKHVYICVCVVEAGSDK